METEVQLERQLKLMRDSFQEDIVVTIVVTKNRSYVVEAKRQHGIYESDEEYSDISIEDLQGNKEIKPIEARLEYIFQNKKGGTQNSSKPMINIGDKLRGKKVGFFVIHEY